MTSPAIAPPATSTDLTSAVKALTDADPGYKRAGNYYQGRVAEVFASVRLRRAMTRTGMSFVFNFARMPVDALTERVNLSAVTATPDPANEALTAVWKRNKMRLVGKQIHRNAFKYGDAYAIVWPDPDDDTQVDIFYNSPRSVRVFYDPENPRRKSFAIKRWQASDGATRVDLFYPDRIEKYAMVGKGKQAKWIQHVDEPGDEWPYSNPFDEIPVFHFRTDDPYGCPEHEGFYGPQDAIHKLIISHMAGVDYQAFPQRYALMEADSDSAEPSDADEDEFAFASGTGATEPIAEGRSQLQADPGSVWQLKGLKSVGQFDVADPKNFTEPMLTYLRMGAQVTNTPLFRIDPSGNIPSGESRKVAEAPFVAKAEDRQLAFEDTWEELVTFVLKVAGAPAVSVDVQWNPVQSNDDLQSWQTLQAKLNAGLPPQQAFLEAGYSSEQIEEWFGDEDGDLAVSVDILVKIGQALSSLGTAVNLGALTAEQLQLLIAAVIGDPDEDGVADIIDPRDVGKPDVDGGPSGMTEAEPGAAA